MQSNTVIGLCKSKKTKRRFGAKFCTVEINKAPTLKRGPNLDKIEQNLVLPKKKSTRKLLVWLVSGGREALR